MKAFVSLLVSLMLCLCVSGAMAYTEGDFEYWVSNGEATVIGYAGDAAEVVVPDTLGGYPVTSIGGFAFQGCDSLVQINLPDRVTTIERYAFSFCSNLASIDLPSGLIRIEEHAFVDSGSLKSIDLPDGVTSIGEWAFYDCSSLESIDLPDGLTSIGEWAFYDCSSIESIDLPERLMSIGNGVFSGCSSLVSIDLPNGLINIGNSAFSNCDSLVSIDLPDGLINIGNSAFSNCDSLVSIDLPDELKSIGDYVFYDCSSLASICLPDGLASIGNSAFSWCDSLVSIDLPEGLTSIGNEAFRYCHDLSMIHLPNSVETIGENAFEYCDLRSLTIPESITSIPYPIADDCDELTSVVLPKELTEIAENAFPDSVMKVYCYKGSAADTWAKDTGKFAIYLDSYDIEKDVQLITPESDGWHGLEEYVFEVGMRYAWKKNYGVAPMAPGKTCTLRCESSDPSVARVDGDVLTFLKNGEATLTVTVEEYPQLSSDRKIEVYYPVESFAFPTAVFIRADSSSRVIPIENAMPENATPYFNKRTPSRTYADNYDKNKIRLYPEDVVGVLRMRVHSELHDEWDDKPYAQFNLVTYDTVNSIAAAVPSRNLETGETYQPDITVTVDNLPFMNEPAAYTLKSSKTSVVKPTDDGRLEAVAPGTATITATTFAGNKTATFNVTVVKATTLNIPVGTKKIEMEAFMSAAAGSVVIPDGCESIGARAFKNCANMRKAEIPNSVTSIADDTFDGCAEGFVIIAPAGSYAAEYAVAHGYTE